MSGGVELRLQYKAEDKARYFGNSIKLLRSFFFFFIKKPQKKKNRESEAIQRSDQISSTLFLCLFDSEIHLIWSAELVDTSNSRVSNTSRDPWILCFHFWIFWVYSFGFLSFFWWTQGFGVWLEGWVRSGARDSER